MLQRIGPVSAHSSGARLSSSAWVAVSGDIFRRSIPMVACPLPKGGRHEGRIGVVAIPPTVLRNVGAASNATGIQSPTSRGTAESRPLGVVITGGSKGLGFAMAQQFLSAGDAVFICGRNEKKLGAALESLKSQFPNSQVFAQPCDVSDAAQVEALAAAAKESLGTLHLWINNAGEVTEKALLIDLNASAITQVVGTNVIGSLLCCRAAIDLMLKQTPSTGTAGPEFHIFNFGFSTWGASLSKTACTHKMTKMALTQLTKSLSEEVVAAGHSHIGVHNLSPGMVLTDLLLKGSSPVARRFFNTLAEEPETVASELVPRIRAIKGTGTSIEFLTPITAIGRVVSGLPQILNGGRYFDKKGDRVPSSELVGGSDMTPRYNASGVRLLYDFPEEEY